MGVKNDRWILEKGKEIFSPFEKELVKAGVISYGVGSYGYDIRLGKEFLVPEGNYTLDPKGENNFRKVIADIVKLPPHRFVLGKSFEYVKIPRETIALCTGKSTYARCGILINITPLEPEWEGYITIAISNIGSRSVYLYSGEGIAQVIFFSGEEVCRISYRDRKGKYQKQKEVTPSRIE